MQFAAGTSSQRQQPPFDEDNHEQDYSGYERQWPLTNFWPVYLGNFFVHQWVEHAWYDQISDFFVQKGLLTKMMYFNKQDRDYWEMQGQCSLLDALVYFVSEEDAQRAIRSCHRTLYFGHRLNVLCGRNSEYVDPKRAARFEILWKPDVPMMETCVENTEMSNYGQVVFARKLQEDKILVEFVDTSNLFKAVKAQKLWQPFILRKPMQKQRFVEGDVEEELQWLLDNNVGFLEQQPRPQILQSIASGSLPHLDTSWVGWNKPRMSWYSRQIQASMHPQSRRHGSVDPVFISECRAQRKAVLEAINVFLKTHQLYPDNLNTVAEKQRRTRQIQFLGWRLKKQIMPLSSKQLLQKKAHKKKKKAQKLIKATNVTIIP